MKGDSNSFLFICERELPPTIALALVLAKDGGADRGRCLVDSVRSSLALWVDPADPGVLPGVLTSPSSVSSSSFDVDDSGSVDGIKQSHSNKCQLKYTN